MTDPISTLRGLCSDSLRRDEELRRGFETLGQALSAAAAGVDVYGSSDNCSLETYGDGESAYGYLYFSQGLRVAYRTTQEDMEDAISKASGDPTFSVKELGDCSAVWLRALARPAIVESLVTSLSNAMRAFIGDSVSGVRVLEATANLPIRDLESALESTAARLNYHKVIDDWRAAQSALGVDPAEAATRACSLLESTCKHILEARGQGSPPSQTIQSLFKAAARTLALSPDQQASDDLRRVASGIVSVAQGVGELRTHAGTAHGGTASRHEVTFSEARLVVNSAGAVATFLLEALLSCEASPPRP